MKKLVLLKNGDTVIEFDETEATAAQRAEAKRIFDEWIAKKLPVYVTKRANGQPDKPITNFNEVESGADTILIPAIVAG